MGLRAMAVIINSYWMFEWNRAGRYIKTNINATVHQSTDNLNWGPHVMMASQCTVCYKLHNMCYSSKGPMGLYIGHCNHGSIRWNVSISYHHSSGWWIQHCGMEYVFLEVPVHWIH